MSRRKRLTALLMAVLLALATVSCGKTEETTEKDPLRVAFLKGPTGIGAAWLMDQNAAGSLSDSYEVTVSSEPADVNTALIRGELDIAAVPTNAASVLYNKTEGQVQIVAINTLGVLYILEKGDSVHNVYDLTGRTIYAAGQGSNPQYVLEYILTEAGLVPGETVFVEYLPADEIVTRMASGSIDLCMLPVPNATTVLVKNQEVRTALDLSEEWASVTNGGSVLTQGCIVARKDVSDERLAAFLKAYQESINYMKNSANLDAAAALAVKYEVIPSEAIAKKALPDCNLTYVAGASAMREALTGYFSVLWSADPASVGGSVPDDAFYRETA